MKIQIENKGAFVNIKVDKSLNKRQASKLFESVYDLFAKITSEEDCCNAEPEIAERPLEEILPKLKHEAENFNIRQRLPNNVVDVKELDIKKAVTENALVRCPSCGQSHCLAVPSNGRIYLMRRDYQKEEFGIITSFASFESEEFVNACCKPETDRKAYFEDLQGFQFTDTTDFTVDNDTEIFCPVCCKSDRFGEWKDAFSSPLEFFETEHLCDACGGEKLERIVKGQKTYQCDNCGLEMDYKEE